MSIRKRRGRGLKSWNFWTPIRGTVYRITALNPSTGGRTWRAYFGKTAQDPWTKRIEEHLWGPDAKDWADTVPGWRPRGNIHEVIAARGARIVVRFWMVPLILTVLERAVIVWGRPVYNDRDNRRNPRRVTISEAKRQRRSRDVQRAVPLVGAVARWFRLLRQLAVLAVLCTLIGVALTAVL